MTDGCSEKSNKENRMPVANKNSEAYEKSILKKSEKQNEQ